MQVFQDTTGADVRRQVRELLPEELYPKRFRLLLGMTELKGETTLLELGATETVTLTMALSPCLLALTADDQGAQIVDLCSREAPEAPEVLCNLNINLPGCDLAVSHDGNIVALTTQDDHFLFSTDSGECLHTFDYRMKFGNFTQFEIGPDETFALGLYGHPNPYEEVEELARWSVASGRAESLRREQGLFGFEFSPDGQLLLLVIERGDSTIAELRTVQDFDCLQVFEGSAVCHIFSRQSAGVSCFSADSHQVVTIPANGAPKVWEALSGRCLHTLRTRTGIAGFAGRNVLTWSENGTLEMWSSKSGERLFAVANWPYVHRSRTLVVSPVGDLACSWRRREDENGEEIYAACLWCTESGHVVRELTDLTLQSPDIVFSPGGECITYYSRNEDTRMMLLRTVEGQFERLPALDLRNFVGFVPCHGR